MVFYLVVRQMLNRQANVRRTDGLNRSIKASYVNATRPTNNKYANNK